MMTPFARLATTVTLSLGLALSPISATPAKANGNNDAWVAALLGLAIVGAIIDDNRGDRYRGRDLYRPDRPSRKALPARCLQRFETRDGTRRYFGARCLDRNYRFASRLPARCETQIRIRNRHGDRVRREVFNPRCLRREGYWVAGRR
ncbi:hypothetical protein [Aliiroseovarius sp.]|uniref:hypothetical protein n=1 Tax=Aliiroseovarius sp. TaxID=1872442 RepID=UPI00261EEA42|nr:hypothetical protein [Aliiroseovarius sp.]